MKNKHHTPEPWKVVNRGDEECSDIDANGPEGWNGDVTIAMNIGNNNARRIAACVNACSGISTELLEECLTLSFSSYTQVRETQEEREHFRAALVSAMAKVESAICCHPNAVRTLLDEAMEIAGSAIANGKGGTQ